MRRQPCTEAAAGAVVAVATAAAAVEVTAVTAGTRGWPPAATAITKPRRRQAGWRAGAPLLTGSRGEPWTGRKQTTGRLVVGLLLAALVLIIILAAVGVL